MQVVTRLPGPVSLSPARPGPACRYFHCRGGAGRGGAAWALGGAHLVWSDYSRAASGRCLLHSPTGRAVIRDRCADPTHTASSRQPARHRAVCSGQGSVTPRGKGSPSQSSRSARQDGDNCCLACARCSYAAWPRAGVPPLPIPTSSGDGEPVSFRTTPAITIKSFAKPAQPARPAQPGPAQRAATVPGVSRITKSGSGAYYFTPRRLHPVATRRRPCRRWHQDIITVDGWRQSHPFARLPAPPRPAAPHCFRESPTGGKLKLSRSPSPHAVFIQTE